jgi:pyridoxine kinase
MAGMIDGVEANGLFPLVDSVVTGHFSSAEQVSVAVSAIDRIHAAPRGRAHAHAPDKPIIIIDPVMGDDGRLYVKPEVADVITRELVPRADLIAPNLYEFGRIVGSNHFSTAEDVARAARARGGRWLVSSVPSPVGVGVLYVDEHEALLAETSLVQGDVPNGTGDFLTLRFAGGLVSGEGAGLALSQAAGATHLVVERTVAWRGTELCVAALTQQLIDPPHAAVRALSL